MGLFQNILNIFGSNKQTEETKKDIVLDTYSSVEKLLSKKDTKVLSSLYVSGPARAGKGDEILKFIKQFCTKYNRLQTLDLSGIVGLEEIPEEALSECRSLTKLILPSGLRAIKTNAFNKCTNLESVVFPEGLERIYEGAFAYCPKLTNVTLPHSLYRLGKEVFSGDDSLTEITITSRVESIGTGCFSCRNLKSIVVEPHNPSYIAVDNVLYSRNGSALIQYACGMEAATFTVPNTVAKIVEEAFAGCQNIHEIKLASEVNIIGKGAFRNCSQLQQLSFPSRVENIGEEAFKDCTGLTSVNFEKGITNIGSKAFFGCSGLSTITLPNSLMKVGDEAFANCSNLIECSLPNSVEYVGKNIFVGTKINK